MQDCQARPIGRGHISHSTCEAFRGLHSSCKFARAASQTCNIPGIGFAATAPKSLSTFGCCSPVLWPAATATREFPAPAQFPVPLTVRSAAETSRQRSLYLQSRRRRWVYACIRMLLCDEDSSRRLGHHPACHKGSNFVLQPIAIDRITQRRDTASAALDLLVVTTPKVPPFVPEFVLGRSWRNALELTRTRTRACGEHTRPPTPGIDVLAAWYDAILLVDLRVYLPSTQHMRVRTPTSVLTVATLPLGVLVSRHPDFFVSLNFSLPPAMPRSNRDRLSPPPVRDIR